MYANFLTENNNKLNLKLQVMNMKSHIPLIILMSSHSNYIIRILEALQKTHLTEFDVCEGLITQKPISSVVTNFIRINTITPLIFL